MVADRSSDHYEDRQGVTTAEDSYLLTDPVLVNALFATADLFRRFSGIVRLEPAEDTYRKHQAHQLREDDTIVLYADVSDEYWRRFSTFLTDTPCSRGKYLTLDEQVTLCIGKRHEDAVPVTVPTGDGLPRYVDVYMPTTAAHQQMRNED